MCSVLLQPTPDSLGILFTCSSGITPKSRLDGASSHLTASKTSSLLLIWSISSRLPLTSSGGTLANEPKKKSRRSWTTHQLTPTTRSWSAMVMMNVQVPGTFSLSSPVSLPWWLACMWSSQHCHGGVSFSPALPFGLSSSFLVLSMPLQGSSST